jgi:hypothetical protein
VPEPYVREWLDDLIDHPVIAELKAHPGRWAVLPPYPCDSHLACVGHPNVETKVDYAPGGLDLLPMARWLTNDLVLTLLLRGRPIRTDGRDD